MPRLKQKLLILLKGAARIAVVGIGSELRADDAVGLLVLEHLRKKLAKQKNRRLILTNRNFKIAGSPLAEDRSEDGRAQARPLHLRLFNGGTAPENLTGEIRCFNPGHLIMIDAVELGKRPGTVALVDISRIENTAFLTHKLPIKLMLDYLAAEMTFTTIFIGIQPRSLEFEGKISKPVIRAGRELADLLTAAFRS